MSCRPGNGVCNLVLVLPLFTSIYHRYLLRNTLLLILLDLPAISCLTVTCIWSPDLEETEQRGFQH